MLASEVHYPQDPQQALQIFSRDENALLFAGGSGILRMSADRLVHLPPTIICLSKIAEFKRMNRTERFFEIGASITLSTLLDLSAGKLPEPIPQLLSEIAVRPIRNIATLGGNLAARDRFMDLWSVCAAMDATIELKDRSASRWVNLNRMSGADGRPDFPRDALLSRVRIPLDSYDFHVVLRSGARGFPSQGSNRFVCLAKTDRGLIDAFTLVYAGMRCFRARDLEAALTGRSLPLSVKDARAFARDYCARLTEEWGALSVEFQSIVDAIFRRLSG